jgi:hypothetical protein
MVISVGGCLPGGVRMVLVEWVHDPPCGEFVSGRGVRETHADAVYGDDPVG